MSTAELVAPVRLRPLLERLASGAGPDPVATAWQRIDDTEEPVHAWVHLDRGATGGDGPLAGVPVGIKDIIDVAGLPTGCGSPLRAGVVAAGDAWVTARLRSLGAVILGKTVTTEFAYFAPRGTANPWDLDRTPGGSSSGSAAAVSTGAVPLAIGSQTAGSLTRPASYCGISGFVPARGTLPTTGVTGLSPTLDTLGLLAAQPADVFTAWHLLTEGTAGEIPEPEGRPDVWWWDGTDVLDVEQSMQLALGRAREAAVAAGWSVRDLDWGDDGRRTVEAHSTVMPYEAARERADAAARPELLSAPLRELLETGAALPEQTYRRALDDLGEVDRRLGERLGERAVIIGPAAAGVAPGRGDQPRGYGPTGPPTLSRVGQGLGRPVVTVPGLRGPDGLPLGLQVIGVAACEPQLFGIADRLAALLGS